MTIKYKDIDIELKYSLRSMLAYENITEKTFAPTSMTDIITYMYCVVITSAKDYSINYDEFLDYIDDKFDLIEDFSNWLQSEIQTHNNLKKN